MSLQDQFQEDERAGFIKQIADKLYQGIVEAYDTPEAQKRRWIWELVQNAKDVTNAFGNVLIRITLNEGFVLFEHNGDPFNTKSLTGLIQQVSSKPSRSNDAATTGKFGTGFISTHMLSKKITVDGLLEYGDLYKKFQIALDREASSTEELAIKVESLLKIKDSLTDDIKYPPVSKFERTRLQTDFDSKFHYELKSETISYAKQGLNDLIKTGPYALLINTTIGQFEITDQTDSVATAIKRSDSAKQVSPVNVFTVDITSSDKKEKEQVSLAYKTNEKGRIVVAVPVKIAPDGLVAEILPLPDTVPVLFKEFPLIGTEKWMFSFVCHSTEFQPKEPRDGLRLHIETEEDSGQAKVNRDLLREAVTLAASFVKLLSEQDPCPGCIHLLAQSGIPAEESKDDVIAFIKEIQIDYRNEIKTLKIVQTSDGPKTMTECRFPVLEEKNITEFKSHDDFYELCDFHYGKLLPLQKYYHDWRIILDAEPSTWGTDLMLSLKNLLDDTTAWTDIKLIHVSDADSALTIFDWFNRLYKFLSTNQLEHHHKDYKLIPNQRGSLISLSIAINDADKNIPEVLKDIAEAFGKKYRENLADDKIHCKELNNHLTIDAISKDLAPDIGRLQKPEIIDPHQLAAIIELCRIPTGFSTADDNRRTAMVSHLSAFIPEWRDSITPVPAMSDFNFDPPMRVITRWCLYKIAKAETIGILKEQLNGNETDEEVVQWLDTLTQLVFNYPEFNAFLESYSIYPNQLLQLCFRKDLSADIDTIPEEIKDVHDTLLPDLKLRKKLLHLKFKPEKVDGKISFLQVAGEVDQEIRRNDQNMETAKIRDAALNMINWLSKEENQPYIFMFSWIDGNKASIVLKTLHKDQEHIFKILQSNKDFKKLADIAANKNFEAIAELAESGYDIADLKKLNDMANRAGGIDEIERKLEHFLEEKQDLSFRMELGTHVENLFRDIFKAINPDFEVRRDPVGQDFILFVSNKWEYRVEIKSHAVGKQQVHMSMKQGETSANHPEHYSLCVLERPGNLKLADIDYFKAHSLYVPDIGVILKSKVIAADQIKDILKQNNSEEGGIDFDSTDYKYRIGKKIFTGKSSQSFDRFLGYITQQLKNI